MGTANRLKQCRDTLRLSQRGLAEALNCKSSVLSYIERGDREIPRSIILSLITKFKVNSNWLLTGKGDMFTSGKMESKENESVFNMIKDCSEKKLYGQVHLEFQDGKITKINHDFIYRRDEIDAAYSSDDKPKKVVIVHRQGKANAM